MAAKALAGKVANTPAQAKMSQSQFGSFVRNRDV
jgi:hypothetical protein